MAKIIVMSQEKKIRPVNERQLKVYYKHFSRVNSWPPVIFPEIRLCGKWLQDIGFEHGQTINVRQERNKITITVDGDELSANNKTQ